MSLKEFRAALRGAAYRDDVPEVIRLLAERPWPEQVLQLIGDALLVAVTSGSADAHDLARTCIARLHARGWDGDADLAEALAARLGDGPQPLLKPVRVDLEELGSLREGDPIHGGGRVDLATGQIWPQTLYEDFHADESDEEEEEEEDEAAGTRSLWVDPAGSRSDYRDMELFIATVEDEHLVELLSMALSGKGAFRRFKDAIARHPEAADRWYALSEDRVRGRARAWLTSEGYTPHPGRTPSPR
ncbi:hypothetical protein AVL62_16265 [Serinicoccus chungangensis]|uniref:Uncharacterized protein n=1 Tax=Serinicoccus chungangensis TaxID=767452 RepID=A0A0W8I941_9MICO|nr:UPF0158 family protein [Serinicoccus chungangensis]KUG56326.1 hypothetical protein AVL62_16265 [Serinicoccus chungangensis]